MMFLTTTSLSNMPLRTTTAFQPTMANLSNIWSRLASTSATAPEPQQKHQAKKIPIHEEKQMKVTGDQKKEESEKPVEQQASQSQQLSRVNDRMMWPSTRSLLSPTFRRLDDIFRNDPFFSDPFFSDPFFRDEDDDVMFPSLMPVLKSRAMGGKLLRASPGYEIKEDENTYQFAIDVPDGVDSANDLTVNLETDETTGNGVLHITGEKKIEMENGGYRNVRFDQRFSIGADIMETDKLTANLHDGVLTIQAPKLPPKNPPTLKQIPVTEEKSA